VKVGLGIPHLGHFADPDTARVVAVAAEDAGFDSLWAMDRLLSPVQPRTFGYPGRTDGALPAIQRRVLDPIVTLTLAAAVTDRIRLGTDVLVAPWYPPVLLARTLAALDQVSRGRLTVGLGLGWSVDEFEAAGASMTGRGARLEEILDVLANVWSPGIAAIDTTREHISASIIDAKPTQLPGPPVLLAAFNPAGLDRIARRADGWLPFGLPLTDLASGWSTIHKLAARYGRDPQHLQLVVRADPIITDLRLGGDRTAFAGTRQQIADDIRRLQDLGANEVIVDLQTSTCTATELIDTALDLTSEPTAAAA